MKKEFIKIAIARGFDYPAVRYTRPSNDVVVYYLTIWKDGKMVANWSIGYIVGEVDTPHSKDRIRPEFIKFLKKLKTAYTAIP